MSFVNCSVSTPITSSMEVEPLVATAPDRVEALVSSVVSEAVSVVVVSLPQPARVSASRAEAARMLTAFFVVLFMVFFPHFFLVFILLLVSDKYSLPAFG